MRAGGRRLFAYVGRRSTRRYERLGSARLRRAGRGRFVATMRFRRPSRTGRRDVLAVCVRGLARAGWGYPDAFERGCGKRRMTYRPRR